MKTKFQDNVDNQKLKASMMLLNGAKDSNLGAFLVLPGSPFADLLKLVCTGLSDY